MSKQQPTEVGPQSTIHTPQSVPESPQSAIRNLQLPGALPSTDDKAVYVRTMFDRIAPRYDALNRLFSFQLDQRWRRQTIRTVAITSQDVVVDLACGTGDLSELAAQTGARVIGVDFAGNMLVGARRRGIKASFVQADAGCVPLPDASTTVVLSGFALRNFVSIPVALAEAARILKPDGRMALLEVDTPANVVLRWGHQFYFNRVVPFVGGLLSDRQAYAYLPKSVSYLPSPSEFRAMIEQAGFQQVVRHPLSGGIAQLIVAQRR
ncbi:MAG: ubiquinone/menaquinone biosynthesis methyltransferase [Deltaproteobacteria bacterium]|nr:ubiquinone/menaquinone biosynthesis methyltransferase [Deltaproteobacteria bacterium]